MTAQIINMNRKLKSIEFVEVHQHLRKAKLAAKNCKPNSRKKWANFFQRNASKFELAAVLFMCACLVLIIGQLTS